MGTSQTGLPVFSLRRLRDTGRQWYWIFLGLIPLVGIIILIVFYCQPTSNFEGNQV